MKKPEGLADLDAVERVVQYQGAFGDWSAILNGGRKQAVRVHYLKNLREEWKWVDDNQSEDEGVGYVILKRRKQ